MTDAIRAAQAVLQAECDRLTAAIQAKGYPKAHVEIWIARGKQNVSAYVHERPSGMPYVMPASDAGKLVDDVEAAIAATPDINAYDAWFAWAQAGEAA